MMPYCKFILPTAGTMPVTMNGGYRMNAWYDIAGLDDRASESCDGIEGSVERIQKLLDREHALVCSCLFLRLSTHSLVFSGIAIL